MIMFTIVKLSSIDLNLLLVLHTVIQQQSLVKAASKLHVTPPAVSNALSRAREVLADPLFVRSGRGLTPTPRALELAPVLATMFQQLELALGDSAVFHPASTTRSLTLALSDADQSARLPRLAKAFVRELPRARLEVVNVDTLLSTGGLAGTVVDVAIGPHPPPEEHVQVEPLYEEEGVLIARSDHPRIQRQISKEQFNSERHVDIHLALGRGGVGHRIALQAFARLGLTRDIAVTVPSFAAAAMVVASTDLISGMPKRSAEALRRAMPLQILTTRLPPLRFPMTMMWHQRTDADPAAAYLRALIRKTFPFRGQQAASRGSGR